MASWDPTAHHTKSFLDCINVWLPDIINHARTISTELEGVKYGFLVRNYRFVLPEGSPQEALCMEKSYTGKVVVDVDYFETSPQQVKNTTRDILLCEFPVMLGLGVQQVPFSGSFVVNGKQVYIPIIKSVTRNFPLRLVSQKNGKYVQVRSEHLNRVHRSTSTCELVMPHRKNIFKYFVYVRLPFVDQIIPIGVIVLALGGNLEHFFEGFRRLTPDLTPEYTDLFHTVLVENLQGCSDQEQAVLFVARVFGKQDAHYGTDLLHSEFLPHMNKAADPARQKLHMLQLMFAHQVLFYLDILPPTDRDSVMYSRMVTSGWSLAQMFRSKYIMFIKRCSKLLRQALKKKKPVDTARIFNHESLSRRIHSAIARGVWSSKRKGISRQLIVTNNFGIISQLRIITTPHLAADGKHMKSRMIQPDSHGYLCAADTPNGEGCGLIHSMALLASISHSLDPVYVNWSVRRHLGGFITDAPLPTSLNLFGGDGLLLGFVADYAAFTEAFRDLRSKGGLEYQVCLTRTHDSLWVMSSYGRLLRVVIPPLTPERQAQIMQTQPTSLVDLLVAGCVVHADPGEIAHLRTTYTVADWVAPTYLEVNNIAFVGFIPALSPFFRHDQGPRLAYWSGMSKQQICGPGVHSNSGSSTEHTLWYAQKPLVQTRASRLLSMNHQKTCINATLALFALPNNQEDALVVNKAALERGMFTSTSVRMYSAQKRGRGSEKSDDIFERPVKSRTVGKGVGSCSKLQENGLPLLGTRINGGEAVIGRTIPTKKRTKGGKRIRRDKSVFAKALTSSEVVSVLLVQKATSQLAKVRLSQTDTPQIGDKLSSRHSQKGTIGEVRPPEDMIFSAQTGMIPDLVMLPQGNFSRMTIGQILEMLCGKASSVAGETVTDDQIFAKSGQERLRLMGEMLRQYGFSASGNEIMVDGVTGQQISCPIFVGVVSYTKLYHMVSHKLHARDTGPVNWLTRQPTEGRRRKGGLRMGVMEMDCLVSHGAAALINERTFETSDPSYFFVCKDCGHRAVGNLVHQYFHCAVCGHGNGVRKVKCAHVSQLFCQEIQAIGVKTQFTIKQHANV